MREVTLYVYLTNGESLVKYHDQGWCKPSYSVLTEKEREYAPKDWIEISTVTFVAPEFTLEWLADPVLRSIEEQVKKIHLAAHEQIAELEKTKSVLLMLAGPGAQGTRDNSQAEDAQPWMRADNDDIPL